VKKILEQLIKSERALDSALLLLLGKWEAAKADGDVSEADMLERERFRIAKAYHKIVEAKDRLTASADATERRKERSDLVDPARAKLGRKISIIRDLPLSQVDTLNQSECERIMVHANPYRKDVRAFKKAVYQRLTTFRVAAHAAMSGANRPADGDENYWRNYR